MQQTALRRFAFGGETRAPTWGISWRTAVVVGRVFLSSIFIVSGTFKLMGLAAVTETLAAKGLPAPQVLAVLAAAVEIIGGLSVLTGTLARFGGLILFLFLIPTTVIFHNFWDLSGAEMQTQLTQFLKNLGIMGGLLLLIAFGAGKVSLDARIKSEPG